MTINTAKIEKELPYKVGDLVTAYVKGYHIIIGIQRRYVTQRDFDTWARSRGLEVGDEYSPLVTYRPIYTSTFKPCPPKAKLETCDGSYIMPLTHDDLDLLIQRYVAGINNLREYIKETS